MEGEKREVKTNVVDFNIESSFKKKPKIKWFF